MNVFLLYKGCFRRYMDSQRILDFFRINGHKVVYCLEEADCVLFETCSVVRQRDAENIEILNEFIKPRLKPGARLVVCGCMPAVNEDLLFKHFNGFYFTPRTLNKLNDFIRAKIPIESISVPFRKGKPSKVFEPGIRWFGNFENNTCRIKIAQGCMGNCSYCGIRKAIGRLKSEREEVILDKFRKGLEEGYFKFCFDNEDTAAYGQDKGSSFPELLRKILNLKQEFILGFIDLNPRWMEPHYNTYLKLFSDPRIKEVGISFQVGNDRISKLMKRSYDIQRFHTFMRDLKKRRPDLILGASFIVGFPSETEEEFEDTLRLLTFWDWAFIHAYDDRPGTRSSKMKDKIPHSVKQRRVERARLVVDGENLKGFYEKEPGGYRWARPRASYDIQVTNHVEPLGELKIILKPVISYPQGQNVIVSFQELSIQDEQLDSPPVLLGDYRLKNRPPDQDIALEFRSPLLARAKGIIRIILETDRSTIPSEHGGQDSRTLGIYVRGISLR